MTLDQELSSQNNNTAVCTVNLLDVSMTKHFIIATSFLALTLKVILSITIIHAIFF